MSSHLIKLDYPLVRHYQRYEYLQAKGYIYNKSVADIGCGDALVGFGIFIGQANKLYAVDPILKTLPKGHTITSSANRPLETYIYLLPIPVEQFNIPVDVCTAFEVFEHVPNPEAFIKKLSTLAPYLFITTPLAAKTAPTKNKDHVAEYSSKDFKRILSTCYNIEELVYQHSNLDITTEADATGCSMDTNHVVQMAWCRRKDA